MTTLDTDFSSEEESDDGSDIETVPMETITGDESENEEVKTTENAKSDSMEPIMTATSKQAELKSVPSNPAKSNKSPSKSPAKPSTMVDAMDESEDKPEDEPDETAPEFTTAEEIVETKTYEELYNSKSNQELVSNLKDRSDIIKDSIKLILIGVSPEYIKFEPARDVFGFLMSKDQKERTSIFQTQTCNASIQHVNVPSLNTKLTVDESKYEEIFSTAVNEENPMNLVEALKSNNSIMFENKNAPTNANTSIAPFTPFLEMMLTETKDDNGYVAILAGDKLVNAFNFLRCKTLHLDDSAPKKVYLSSILETLAESGAKNIVVVNLSANTGSTMNMSSSGPAKEPTTSMNEMESGSDSESGSEDEDLSSSEEAEVEAPMKKTGAGEVEPAGAEEVEPAGAEEVEPAGAEEVEPARAEEVEPAGAEEVEPAGAEEVESAEPAPTEGKVEVPANAVEQGEQEEEKPPKLNIGPVIPAVGGKKTKKKLQLKLKSVLKKTRSKK
jgi:hypothetical protein